MPPKHLSDADLIAALRPKRTPGPVTVKLNPLQRPSGERLSDEELLQRAAAVTELATAPVAEAAGHDDAQAQGQALGTELATFQPQELSLDMIDSVPGRRRKLRQEQFDELRENLRENPLVHPITVRRKDDGRYEVISGENRLAAYRELGKTNIRVSVLDVGEQGAERAAFYANLIAHDLPDFEKFRGFEREQKATGASLAEMARLAGVHKASISRLFAFSRLPPEALAELERRPDVMGAACAEELAKLCTSANVERVVEAVRLIAAGKINQAQAPAHVRSMPRRSRPAARTGTVKAGKFKFAEYRTSGPVIRLEFHAEVDMDEACQRIEALLNDMATKAR
jgi:ParB family chromosome partitioning protein